MRLLPLRSNRPDPTKVVRSHTHVQVRGGSATQRLERLADMGSPIRGIAEFTLPDVWHTVDHGVLEINLCHGDYANVAPGDALLDRAVVALTEQGSEAHLDEGRIEVSARWQRRP